MIRWPTALAAILVAFVQNAYGQWCARSRQTTSTHFSCPDVLHQERSILDALDDYVFQARLAQEAVNIAEENRRISERRARPPLSNWCLLKVAWLKPANSCGNAAPSKDYSPICKRCGPGFGGEDPY